MLTTPNYQQHHYLSPKTTPFFTSKTFGPCRKPPNFSIFAENKPTP